MAGQYSFAIIAYRRFGVNTRSTAVTIPEIGRIWTASMQ